MTIARKNTPQEIIKVVQAFTSGKSVEWSVIGFPVSWKVENNPAWNFQDFQYRIKPEPVKVKVALFQSKVSLKFLSFTEDNYKHFVKSNSGEFFWVQVSEWVEIETDANSLLNAE